MRLLLFIIYIISSIQYTIYTSLSSLNYKKIQLRNNLDTNKSYQIMNNLEEVYFSPIDKIAIFKYYDGNIDILNNNISQYYRKLYKNSKNNTKK